MTLLCDFVTVNSYGTSAVTERLPVLQWPMVMICERLKLSVLAPDTNTAPGRHTHHSNDNLVSSMSYYTTIPVMSFSLCVKGLECMIFTGAICMISEVFRCCVSVGKWISSPSSSISMRI